MNIHCTSYKDLIVSLKDLMVGIIAVDGVCVDGRKALAAALSAARSFPVVSSGPAMKEAVEKAVKKGPVIVEGVVLLEALKKTGLRAALNIYVIPGSDSPARGLFDGIVSRDYDELMNELEHRPADRHTVDYHYTFHPIIHADFLLQGQKKIIERRT
jgi:hypothetical protein